MVFVKPMESVGGLCENHKAHAGMGRIFPLWNEASECTEKIQLGLCEDSHHH